MTLEEKIEKLRSNGYTVREHDGEIQVQVGFNVSAIRVSSDDPKVMEVMKTVAPATIAFKREGVPGFTLLYQGIVQGHRWKLKEGGSVEIIMPGEWITIPSDN